MIGLVSWKATSVIYTSMFWNNQMLPVEVTGMIMPGSVSENSNVWKTNQLTGKRQFYQHEK